MAKLRQRLLFFTRPGIFAPNVNVVAHQADTGRAFDSDESDFQIPRRPPLGSSESCRTELGGARRVLWKDRFSLTSHFDH